MNGIEICGGLPDSVCIIGSTGSVGTQALDVARTHGIQVEMISANRDIKSLEAQVREFSPKYCGVADCKAAAELRTRISDTQTKVLCGSEGICDGISSAASRIIVNSTLGEAGLMPTLAALDSGKRLALASKESLVIAGDIVREHAAGGGGEIIPVDSEHSAIFQSLQGNDRNRIKKIILTASGGPFFGYSKDMLGKVTREMALAHPTWKMGNKITVDSATLMNKGFEVIEAVHLFGVEAKQIEVVVHRESIIHSAVEYIDNAIIAQMGVPDMRHCIQYALTYPLRCDAATEELDLFAVGKLTFARPDTETFPLLKLAVSAVTAGGAVPAVLNAANEIAVASFLDGKISFTDIFDVVSRTVSDHAADSGITKLDDIIACDREARVTAQKIISEL